MGLVGGEGRDVGEEEEGTNLFFQVDDNKGLSLSVEHRAVSKRGKNGEGVVRI